MKEKTMRNSGIHALVVAAMALLFIGLFMLMPKDVNASDMIDLSKGKITLSQSTFTYDGTAHEPGVTVTVNGEEVYSWQYDYDYPKYSNNVSAGKAKVIVRGDGYYTTGTLTKTFTIKKRKLTKKEFSPSKTEFVYNGKVRKISGRNYFPNGNSRFMKRGRDIKVISKKLKKVGKYKVTIRGIGNFKGKLKYTVTIRPKNPKGVKLAKRNKNSFVVKWKKVSNVTGYKVSYWNDKKSKWINKTLKKKRRFTVPVGKDYTGAVVVYSYKKVGGKTIKSNGKYYSNGVKPRAVAKLSVTSGYGGFTLNIKRDGYYELWTATNKSFTENFKPFTFYAYKGDKRTYTSSYGEQFRFIKLRLYTPTSNGNKLYGKWSKVKRVNWY